MKNTGKDLELIVTMIQQAIEPEAIVEHNRDLPVINSLSGRKRQCDIVIRSGPPHRRTLTIVETQDRASQVDINTFNGWLLKLQEVGAQHLVCVSRHDYPESIKEKAILEGNKVKLITIKDTKPNEIPPSFFKSNFKYINYQLINLESPKIIFSKAEAISLEIYDLINDWISSKKFNPNDNIFSFDKVNLKSIYNLCQEANNNLTINGEGVDILDFDKNQGQPLYFLIEGKFTRIGLWVTYKWINQVIEYPITIMSYEQQDDGSLAWILEGKYDTPGGIVSFKAPFIKKENYYIIPGIVANLGNYNNLTLQILNS